MRKIVFTLTLTLFVLGKIVHAIPPHRVLLTGKLRDGLEQEKVECLRNALEVELLLGSFKFGNPNPATVGSMEELKDILYAKSKLSEKEYLMTVLALIYGANLEEISNPLLRDTLQKFQEFTKESNTASNLLICVVSGEGCESGNIYGEYHPITRKIHIRKVVNGKREDWLNSDNSDIANYIKKDLIAVKTVDNMSDLTHFPGFFLHEFRHFLDFRLLETWIQANRALIESGAEPDPNFKKFVVYSGNSIVVDKSFLFVFLESRGYAVTKSYYETFGLLTDEMKKNLFGGFYNNLRSQSVDLQVYAELVKTDDEIFTRGNEIAEQMLQTIQRANLAQDK